MALKYRHICWDWNGTLLDDVEACVDAINRMMSRRALGALCVTRYRDIFSFPVQEYYRRLGFVLEEECWEEMAREFHEFYLGVHPPTLHEQVPEILSFVQEAGVGMSILSACERRLLTEMVEAFGLSDYFDHINGLDDLYARSKLAQGRQLVGQLALASEEVLLVGDTLHDAEVADELGCDCLLVSRGHQSADRLRQTNHTVLDQLGAVLAFVV